MLLGLSLILRPFAPPPLSPALCLEVNSRSVSIWSCKAEETCQKLQLPLFFAPAVEGEALPFVLAHLVKGQHVHAFDSLEFTDKLCSLIDDHALRDA